LTLVTGVDACRKGWVAVSLLTAPGLRVSGVRTGATLDDVLDGDCGIVGIDMPLGLLASGWRACDRAARGLLGPRRSSVFAIPPAPVWHAASYQEANALCRELTGQGFSIQAWGLRVKLLEANRYREAGRHELHEVHPELAFAALAGAPLALAPLAPIPALAPLALSKHTAAGLAAREKLLAAAGIQVTGGDDVLDAAAAAWSASRIAAGTAVVLPGAPSQPDRDGREITIRY
jgi:predicted RNase H-like nuclease